MGLGIGRIVDQIARIISNPASNLAGAMLLLAMVVLVLLILAIGALITILPSGDEDEDYDEDDEDDEGDSSSGRVAAAVRESGEGEDPETRAGPAGEDLGRSSARADLHALSLAVPVVLFAAAIVSGWYATGQPATCGSCHATAPSLRTWRSGDHASTGCVACHEDGGVGLPSAFLYRLSDVFVTVAGADDAHATRPIPPHRCLGCHGDVERETLTVGSVRVSHKEFLSQGYDCLRCHSGVGHSRGDAPGRSVDMNHCVSCHDGKTASSDCSTCHLGDPSTAVRVDRALFPKAEITPPAGCRGCHQTETCDECHGLEMPHPKGFETAKGHARIAAFDAKEVCWRCHVKQDCRRCHRGDFNAHGPNWAVEHRRRTPLDGRDTCACHVSSNFCGLCHETSKR